MFYFFSGCHVLLDDSSYYLYNLMSSLSPGYRETRVKISVAISFSFRVFLVYNPPTSCGMIQLN